MYAFYSDCLDFGMPNRILSFYNSKTEFLDACKNFQNGIFIMSSQYFVEKYINKSLDPILSKDIVMDSYPVSLLDFSYSEEMTSFAINYPKVFFSLAGILQHDTSALTEIKESINKLLPLMEKYIL